MVESAARRDRVDSQAVSAWYLWEAPAKPACVYLSFELIDRLEREVVENFRSLTSRGSEVGGILLGAVAPGSPVGISVEDYEAIPCDYSRGPLYRLSDADLARFERAIEQRSTGNIQVVGFFRSHTRKGLALDAEDLAFLDARFRSPHTMALLVRPFATKASVAGVFLRENGGFNSEASALEFPFRSEQLTPSKRRPEHAAAPPQPAATRAQVVPIATRREITTPPPEPVIETPKAPPAPEAKVAAPTQPASAPPASTPVAKAPAPSTPSPATGKSAPTPPPKSAAATVKTPPPPAKPATAPAPTKPASAAKSEAPKTEPQKPSPSKQEAAKAEPAKVETPKVDPPKSAAPKPAPASDAVAAGPKVASKVPMLTGLLAAAILAFVLLFVYPGFLHRSQHAALPNTVDSSPLTLHVEHTGTDLLLTWNRDAAAIRNASHATLTINDGERHENYDMDLSQLRTGSIVYSPLGGDVSFQMEVVGKDNSKIVTDPLRLLRTRPSPMPGDGQDSKNAKNNTPAQPAPNAQSPQSSAADTKQSDASAEEPKQQGNAPVKPFDASSLSGRLRPARATELADAPTPAAGGLVAPKVNTDGSLPFASLPSAPVPPPVAAPSASTSPAPAPARTTAPPPAPAATKSNSASSSGGQIQAAQLISRKEPEYPLLARQMGAKGTVELIATIGTDGSVKAVKVVKGHPLLVKAAEDAVMQWKYRPTLLNGAPVQNDTRITLNFVAQQ
jgi:TonB family protein